MCKRMCNFYSNFLNSFLLVLFSVIAANAFMIDSVSGFPRAVVSPEKPVVGETIKLFYMLGVNPDGCVPGYKTSISRKVLESNPPFIRFDLKYEEILYDSKDRPCITVMTNYGPTFDLGAAEIGTYEIYVDSKLVTQFKVIPPPLQFLPENPGEGDSVIINQVLGYGSSSCSPLYKSSYEVLSIEGDDQYAIKLTYSVTDRSDQEVCTADYRPYGPEWKIPSLRVGQYNIYLNNELYSTLTVQNKNIPAYVSIEGMVAYGGAIDAMRYPYVAQCTVAVITFQKFSSEGYEKIETTRYYGITDVHGKYTIKNIPGSILKSNCFIAAVKGDTVGYARLTSTLMEQMTVNLSVYYYRNKTEDSVLVNQGEDIIDAFRALNPALSVDNKVLPLKRKMELIAIPGGFQIVNHESQALTITAFSMNGKKIWSTTEKLTSGSHKFRIPAISSGVVLVKVEGELYSFSRVLKLSR